VTEPPSQSGWTRDAEQGVRCPTDREFRLFRCLIEDETGIHLSDAKKALLTGRLSRRLRELGLRTFSAYLDRVASDGPERTAMIDLVCTNETSFFREAWQFDFLRGTLLPHWESLAAARRRPRRIRAWSAACSSGEEPYSLGMVLLDSCPPHRGWNVEVLATDVSTRMLARAEAATYPAEDAVAVPPRYRDLYLSSPDRPGGTVRVAPEVRALVRFGRINLNAWRDVVPGPFDIVFCRNTLIYFRPETQKRLVTRLVDLVSPGGYLFVGHAESLSGLTGRVRRVEPAIYERS
jgi:chemotaxis protein methyltransferase CheR